MVPGGGAQGYLVAESFELADEVTGASVLVDPLDVEAGSEVLGSSCGRLRSCCVAPDVDNDTVAAWDKLLGCSHRFFTLLSG